MSALSPKSFTRELFPPAAVTPPVDSVNSENGGLSQYVHIDPHQSAVSYPTKRSTYVMPVPLLEKITLVRRKLSATHNFDSDSDLIRAAIVAYITPHL